MISLAVNGDWARNWARGSGFCGSGLLCLVVVALVAVLGMVLDLFVGNRQLGTGN